MDAVAGKAGEIRESLAAPPAPAPRGDADRRRGDGDRPHLRRAGRVGRRPHHLPHRGQLRRREGDPHLLRGQQGRRGRRDRRGPGAGGRRQRPDHRGAHRPAGRVDDGARLRRGVRARDQPAGDLAVALRALPDPAAAADAPAPAGLVAHARPAGAAVVRRLADLVQPGRDLHLGAPAVPADGLPRPPARLDRRRPRARGAPRAGGRGRRRRRRAAARRSAAGRPHGCW